MQHEVFASPQSCQWGVFDARIPPVLEIESGDRVVMHTVSGGPEATPGSDAGFYIPPELPEIQRALTRPLSGGHLLTGPVAVKGAKPGMVLEVRILDIALRQDWGYTLIRPLAGALPEDFPEGRLIHIRLDRERNVGQLPWGVELPLRPFFGVMGVAPPPSWGGCTTVIPRAFGGNLDNKELIAGTTLYLPIFTEGANFSAGDGHGTQGDGEVCVTAIETALTGTFELILRDDLQLDLPRAETPTHYITMGMNPDIDVAAKTALRQMIGLICERTNLSREDAYMLCSLAADLRITQMVNQHNGVHVMLAKTALHGG